MKSSTRFIGSAFGASIVTGALLGIMVGLIHTNMISLSDEQEKLDFQINPKIEEQKIKPKTIKPKNLQKIIPPPPAPLIERQKAIKPAVKLVELKGAIGDFKPLKLDIKPVIIAIADGEEQPIVRVPPIMPMRAERSGHCVLEFDIGLDGKPFNIEARYCTQNIFKRPSIRAATKWNYRPKIKNGQPVIRRGVSTQISFDLTDENGQIIPE